MRVPIANHSTPSAMSLLPTIPPALLITGTEPARYVTKKSSSHRWCISNRQLTLRARCQHNCLMSNFNLESWLLEGSEPKIRPFANAKHPDSASQRPECNGPAPHCPARLFDHEARPAR